MNIRNLEPQRRQPNPGKHPQISVGIHGPRLNSVTQSSPA